MYRLHDSVKYFLKKIKRFAEEFPAVLCPAPLQEATGAESDFKCHLEAVCDEGDHTERLKDPDKPRTTDGHPLPGNSARDNFLAFYRALDPSVFEKQAFPPASTEHACYLHSLYAQSLSKHRSRGTLTTTSWMGSPGNAASIFYEVPFACERAKRDIASLSPPKCANTRTGAEDVWHAWLGLLLVFLKNNLVVVLLSIVNILFTLAVARSGLGKG